MLAHTLQRVALAKTRNERTQKCKRRAQALLIITYVRVPVPIPYLPSQLASKSVYEYEEDVKESHLLVHLIIIIICTRYWLIIITSDSGTEYATTFHTVREGEPKQVKLL